MKVGEVLKNWGSVNDFMPNANEEEAFKLLEAEKKGANRLSILLRLYGRYNKQRTRRERSELTKGSNK